MLFNNHFLSSNMSLINLLYRLICNIDWSNDLYFVIDVYASSQWYWPKKSLFLMFFNWKQKLFSKHQDVWLSNKSKFFARYCSKHFMMRNNCRWIIPKAYAWYFESWCAFHATLLTTTWTILWKHLILHIPGIEN